MFFSHHLVLSTLAFTATEAFSFSEISLPGQSFFTRALSGSVTKRQGGLCPPIWGDVATELRTLFLDATTAECNDDARAAVRASMFLNLHLKRKALRELTMFSVSRLWHVVS